MNLIAMIYQNMPYNFTSLVIKIVKLVYNKLQLKKKMQIRH